MRMILVILVNSITMSSNMVTIEHQASVLTSEQQRHQPSALASSVCQHLLGPRHWHHLAIIDWAISFWHQHLAISLGIIAWRHCMHQSERWVRRVEASQHPSKKGCENHLSNLVLRSRKLPPPHQSIINKRELPQLWLKLPRIKRGSSTGPCIIIIIIIIIIIDITDDTSSSRVVIARRNAHHQAGWLYITTAIIGGKERRKTRGASTSKSRSPKTISTKYNDNNDIFDHHITTSTIHKRWPHLGGSGGLLT